MPIATFDIFDTEYALNTITALEKSGFGTYYNAKATYYSLKEHYIGKEHHRLYWISQGVLLALTSDEIVITGAEETLPILAISFPHPVNTTTWDVINSWLKYQVFGFGPKPDQSIVDKVLQQPATSKRIYTPDGDYVIVEGLPGTCLSTPPDDIDLKNGYTFNRKFDELADVMYYEIIAPSSEIPFTVVVKDFQAKSDVWLFSDIYASNAWDSNRLECKYDFLFLQQLWKHLKLPGEFTTEVVKRRVDACYPDRCAPGVFPESEPVVYRRTMDQVINGVKRKNHELPDFIKRHKPNH